MRVLDLLPRQHRVDQDLELTRLKVGNVLGQLVPQPALVVGVPGPQRAALDADALEQQLADVDAVELRAAHHAEHDPAGVAGRDVEVARKVRGADEVDDDVDALAARGLEDLLVPVGRGPVVEGLGGAELALDEGALVVGPGRGVDGRGAAVLAELDARDGHAAGAGVPEHRLALGELADQVERLRGRDPGLGHAGGLLPRQERRLVQEHLGADGDLLGVRAAVGQAEDFVALLEVAVGARPERGDGARELDAEGRGGLRRQRVLAFALNQVHPVQAECLDLDQRLAILGLGNGSLVVDEEGVNSTGATLDLYAYCQ